MTKTKETPIYRQIVEDFRRKIDSGELKPHDPIPSQTELARIYGTSEMTLRKALAVLVEEDRIYRIRKKGSFIQAPKQGDGLAEGDMDAETAYTKIYFTHQNVRIALLNQHFYQAMLAGIQEVCKRYGVKLSLLNIGDEHSLPDEADAGFILFSIHDTPKADLQRTLDTWKDEGRALVTVQHYFPHTDIPYVIGDNVTGGYLAAQHLLSLGHTRIGIIVTGKSDLEIHTEFSLRLQGYRMALESYKVEFDPDLVVVKHVPEEDEASGYEGFMQLMALPAPPTAVFAATDYKALGALYAARDLGLRVPEDVSIIGYDGLPFGQFTMPRLTTVDQNTYTFGVRAAETILFGRSGTKSVDPIVVPQLIVRDSTGIRS